MLCWMSGIAQMMTFFYSGIAQLHCIVVVVVLIRFDAMSRILAGLSDYAMVCWSLDMSHHLNRFVDILIFSRNSS